MLCSRKFCCCMSLRVGGIIIGVLSLIAALVYGVLGFLVVLDTFTEKFSTEFKRDHRVRYALTEEEAETRLTLTRAYFGTIFGVHVIVAISAILLICGALNNRKSLVVPFLVCGIIHWIVMALQLCYDVYIILDSSKSHGFNDVHIYASLIVIGIFIGLVFEIYILCCVHSLYQYLQKGLHRPQQVMYPAYAQQSHYNPTVTYSVVAKE